MTVDDYLKYGIKPINKDYAKREAILRLCDERISEKLVTDMFEKKWNEFNKIPQRIWLTCTESDLLGNCGHYLVYGSEFICGLAAQLSCKSNLKKFGVPTIFHCDIPIENIPEMYINDVCKKLKTKKAHGLAFMVKGNIEPQDIIDYSQPKRIHDPLIQKTYEYE